MSLSWNSTAYFDGGVDLTEPSLEMFVGLTMTILALVIASAGGIGGGGILVPLFILLLHWSPRYAIPLSNITILGGAIMNSAVNISKRHPEANRPLIVSAMFIYIVFQLIITFSIYALACDLY